MKILIVFNKMSEANDLHEMLKDHTVNLCAHEIVSIDECLLFEACNTLRPYDIKNQLNRFKFGYYHIMVKYTGDYSFKNFT